MWKWIRFLLKLLGLYEEEIARPQQEEVKQKVEEEKADEQEIMEKGEERKSGVDDMSEPELDNILRGE